ncbi:glycoside hydrolase family 2 protein [Xylariaceae sp. FL0662B]|nr:glycoside hydrolase family 2 protein [Xylariaceae sp. FL0662B]
MMAYNSKDHYPRPDFVHASHRWTPINDGWSILFDDEDVGLKEGWHLNGLPATVSISTTGTSGQTEAQRLAAFPELKEKGFEAPKTKEHVKKPINLPFVFQTPASGVHDEGAHEVLWYERTVADPRAKTEVDAGDRVLVRFGAVDYEVTIWASGYPIAQHTGGHVPFDVDITDALTNAKKHTGKADVHLVLRIRDSPHDLAQPRGKQYWAPRPESIFYTPSSGIWQPVWLEVVPATRIGDSGAGTVLRSNRISDGVLEARVAVQGRRAGHAYSVEIEGILHGLSVVKQKGNLPGDKDYVSINLPLSLTDKQKEEAPQSLKDAVPYDSADCWRGNLALWSPDHPTLYDLKINLYDSEGKLVDGVITYTGFRNIDWNNGDRTLRLNGKPLFQALVLDQGYWPETGLTPPSPESLRIDIELSKKMGFNGCRKHQKVEDPIFLYWADRLGYLVWGEIANAYEFTEDYAERFTQEWLEAVKRDINHPSIVTWTPVNESWAYPNLKDNVQQRNHIRSLYYITKTLDPTRPVNDNCGWEHVCTDLSTFHDYSDAPELAKTCETLEGILDKKLWLSDRPFFVGPATAADGSTDGGSKHREGAPVLNTEFGGVNIAPASTSEKGDRDWGYTTASDPKDLLQRIEALVMAVVKPGHCCAFVYTQLTDIEQEVNGLYSFDRREKIPATEVKKIFDAARKIYYDSLPKET